ncbi:hypothetical protein [Mucilaginibacter sp.]|uniref:hypothetical protein n=1 Tax=Mucilaginibacter sp. TaxID=1882438 RepID=UPI00326673B0
MEIVESVYNLYKNIGDQILFLLPSEMLEKLKISYFKDAYPNKSGFSVTFEILIVTRILEDDNFGLVFSTHAQVNAHDSTMSNQFAEGLHLYAALGTTDGRIIDETDELNYLPFNDENIKQIWQIVEKFTISKIEIVKPTLLELYPELSEKKR